MVFSLYDAFVPPVILRLDATLAQIAIAQKYCQAEGLPESDLFDARLTPDMQPYAFQIKAMVMHSHWAIECLRTGLFQSMKTPAPADFAEAVAHLSETVAGMRALSSADVNSLVASPVRYQGARSHGDFDGAYFLMNFSLPNFYFHATTAYDLLRWKGVPVGKFDFLGALPVHANQ